ncbi:hypothetical protein NPIL_699341 [Nephila pilipes]|uniref:Uncharacterized protein n=1 Tax=Nephila pilipes TaxID=299642 RepID=A0A8X6U5I4_NEPPI|nr:hypothetical protein NPIL_699341 [Nephila pilipes]
MTKKLQASFSMFYLESRRITQASLGNAFQLSRGTQSYSTCSDSLLQQRWKLENSLLTIRGDVFSAWLVGAYSLDPLVQSSKQRCPVKVINPLPLHRVGKPPNTKGWSYSEVLQLAQC